MPLSKAEFKKGEKPSLQIYLSAYSKSHLPCLLHSTAITLLVVLTSSRMSYHDYNHP